ncbi:hypothetical protein ABKN59_009700 [Abortiporus biennis]
MPAERNLHRFRVLQGISQEDKSRSFVKATPTQLSCLNAKFKENAILTAEDMSKLSGATGLSLPWIKSWFARMRRKQRGIEEKSTSRASITSMSMEDASACSISSGLSAGTFSESGASENISRSLDLRSKGPQPRPPFIRPMKTNIPNNPVNRTGVLQQYADPSHGPGIDYGVFCSPLNSPSLNYIPLVFPIDPSLLGNLQRHPTLQALQSPSVLSQHETSSGFSSELSSLSSAMTGSGSISVNSISRSLQVNALHSVPSVPNVALTSVETSPQNHTAYWKQVNQLIQDMPRNKLFSPQKLDLDASHQQPTHSLANFSGSSSLGSTSHSQPCYYSSNRYSGLYQYTRKACAPSVNTITTSNMSFAPSLQSHSTSVNGQRLLSSKPSTSAPRLRTANFIQQNINNTSIGPIYGKHDKDISPPSLNPKSLNDFNSSKTNDTRTPMMNPGPESEHPTSSHSLLNFESSTSISTSYASLSSADQSHRSITSSSSSWSNIPGEVENENSVDDFVEIASDGDGEGDTGDGERYLTASSLNASVGIEEGHK